MKKHEKVFLIIFGISIIGNFIGWSLWSMGNGNLFANKKRIQEIEKANGILEKQFENQGNTIKSLRRENSEFEADIRRWEKNGRENNKRAEDKIRELQDIFREFKEVELRNKSTVEQIEESLKRLEGFFEVLFYGWNNNRNTNRNLDKSNN